MGNSSSVPEFGWLDAQAILSGLSQGVLLISPDGSIAWANDAALDMHGATTLDGLGATVQGYCKAFALKYRNNHALTAEQYPLTRAWRGEAFVQVVVDIERDKESFVRTLEMQSVPLVDEKGKRNGAALVMSDVTERFEAERRFEKAFNVNPAPAVICRLADFRYVRVNGGFLSMTGYTQEQVLGRSAYELDILTGAEHREQAIGNIAQNKTVPQMQASLPLPNGKTKYVIVAGQPIDLHDEPCMLFTFIDLDVQKGTEEALRQSEERFSTAFRLAPVPMMLSTFEDGTFVETNDAFLATTGYTEGDMSDGAVNVSEIWAVPDAYRKFADVLKEAGSVAHYNFQLCTRKGVLLDCLASAETVRIQGQDCVLWVIQDISEYKQSEGELIAAIETVMQDASWFSRSVIEKLAQIRRPSGVRPNQAELAELTEREREVLGLICEGLNDAQIGSTLKLARNTVRNHVAAIYSKIDVHRRSDAIVWGRERGIVGVENPPSKKRPAAGSVS